jgi:hypothetical protein
MSSSISSRINSFKKNKKTIILDDIRDNHNRANELTVDTNWDDVIQEINDNINSPENLHNNMIFDPPNNYRNIIKTNQINIVQSITIRKSNPVKIQKVVKLTNHSQSNQYRTDHRKNVKSLIKLLDDKQSIKRTGRNEELMRKRNDKKPKNKTNMSPFGQKLDECDKCHASFIASYMYRHKLNCDGTAHHSRYKPNV